MSKRNQARPADSPGNQRVYELQVFLVAGPVEEEFAEEDPVISRTIEIRGNQTLAKLHEAIFDAFGRWDDHLYEFQVGVKRTMDPKARRYVMPEVEDPFEEQKPAGLVTRTTIDAVGLKAGDAFFYWFDFGDDWWHQINVLAIHEGPGSGKYPRVTASTGANPPQYSDVDDEDDEEDDDEGEGEEGEDDEAEDK